LLIIHLEFLHTTHFDLYYHRQKAKKGLNQFIDYFWETDFEEVFRQNPGGFSDALFPNIGYTYLVNLGTPFVMQLGEASFEIRSDGFLPRHEYMICHHSTGNRIFGIKFKVSPVIFQKKINFSEYREYIYPLAYLIERKMTDALKKARDFDERVSLISEYYEQIIAEHAGSMKQADIVTEILNDCYQQNKFYEPIENIASKYQISTRTLQRYFESTTSISSKNVMQIMRIRKAIEDLSVGKGKFNIHDYGYYDQSHFLKHLRGFICGHKGGEELYRKLISQLVHQSAVKKD
jgi:AraC-like DNA-binding protein